MGKYSSVPRIEMNLVFTAWIQWRELLSNAGCSFLHNCASLWCSVPVLPVCLWRVGMGWESGRMGGESRVFIGNPRSGNSPAAKQNSPAILR